MQGWLIGTRRAHPGSPFAVLRGYVGSDLVEHTASIREVACPFTGEVLSAVSALDLDVAVIHAQQADPAGNVQLWGIVGVQKEAVLCCAARAGHGRGDRRRPSSRGRVRSCCRTG